MRLMPERVETSVILFIECENSEPENYCLKTLMKPDSKMIVALFGGTVNSSIVVLPALKYRASELKKHQF